MERNKQTLDQFVIEANNNINKNVQVTAEKGNKTIHYLDQIIVIKNKWLMHDIYRKSTSMETIIPNDSYHHHRHKVAALCNYYNRATIILTGKKYSNNEIEKIKTIVRNKWWDTGTVNKILQKQKQHTWKHNTTNDQTNT